MSIKLCTYSPTSPFSSPFFHGVFSEMVEKATPLSGGALDNAKQVFEGYLKTVVEHDPGVKGYKMLFGKEEGVTRALDIFFDL